MTSMQLRPRKTLQLQGADTALRALLDTLDGARQHFGQEYKTMSDNEPSRVIRASRDNMP